MPYRAVREGRRRAVFAAADRRGALGDVRRRRCSSSNAASIDEPTAFAPLGARLDIVEHERGLPGNRIYYLAIPPSLFVPTVKQLGARAVRRPPERRRRSRGSSSRSRSGTTSQSACAINDAIAEVFDERQIFRIDHYLGKETVQNILVLRFANSFFEPLFNQKYIDHVQITVAEEEGVGTRAGYYEQAGALRDMVQNHLLQLLALVAMEPPHSLDADVVRDEKLEVMRSLRPIDGEDVDAQRRPRRSTRAGSSTASRCPATARSRASTRPRGPKPSSRCSCSSTTGAGPACRFSCAPASGCRSARARSRST